jgi:cob(I)alamin adenosyltransferase
LFRFEKERESFSELLASQKKEEKQNIINGVNFARKVIDTGGCDVLVLDEILGLIDLEIITVDDIIHLIELRDDYTRLVLTGQNLPPQLAEYADVISKIELEKDDMIN